MSTPEKPAFSQRTHFGEADPRYFSLQKLAQGHLSPLDLTCSNPTAVGLELPNYFDLLSQSPTVYEPDPRGLRLARDALAQAYQARARVRAEQFIITARTSEAYSYVLLTLCDPGDAICVPSPSYPLLAQLAKLAGVRLVSYPISYDGAFHLDLGKLPDKGEIERERIKALLCVSPNNPTGNRVQPEELARLQSLDVPLIFDEVFLPYDALGRGADPLAHPNSLTIILDGLSKRAGAPGLKLGWLLAHGEQANAFLQRAEWVSDAYLSPGSAAQHVLFQVLAREQQAQTLIRTRIATNRTILKEASLQTVGWTQLATDGGFSALFVLPSTRTEDEWWELLCRSGVWLQPGEMYELNQTPAFVLSLLTPPATLRAALERIRELLA